MFVRARSLGGAERGAQVGLAPEKALFAPLVAAVGQSAILYLAPFP